MKKFFAVVLSVLMVFSLIACTSEETKPVQTEGTKETQDENAIGADPSLLTTKLDVTVTVAVAGELQLSAKKVTATDLNSDGFVGVDEILKAAHKDFYKDGEAGFSIEDNGEYAMINKLWGVDTMACGIYVDNAPCGSVYDAVFTDCHVYAYTYKDATTYSDSYSYFEANETASKLALTLYYCTFDDEMVANNKVLAGADVIVDGKKVGVTDKDGVCNIDAPKSGSIITASKSDVTLVPAVYVAK